MATFSDKILELSTLQPGNTVRAHLVSAVQVVEAVISANATVNNLAISAAANIDDTVITATAEIS